MLSATVAGDLSVDGSSVDKVPDRITIRELLIKDTQTGVYPSTSAPGAFCFTLSIASRTLLRSA
jgi:hypothetical protein